jgi:hypothetical protein
MGRNGINLNDHDVGACDLTHPSVPDDPECWALPARQNGRVQDIRSRIVDEESCAAFRL